MNPMVGFDVDLTHKLAVTPFFDEQTNTERRGLEKWRKLRINGSLLSRLTP